jgi:hypothetical protein
MCHFSMQDSGVPMIDERIFYQGKVGRSPVGRVVFRMDSLKMHDKHDPLAIADDDQMPQ